MLRSGRRARSAHRSRGAALPDSRRIHRPARRPARRATGALLDLRHPRPVGRHPPRGGRRGLYRADAHPGPGHPVRPCRTRRARRRPDRDRQDRRVHAAHPRAAQGPGEHELLARPPSGPGADPHADPGAGDADRRERGGVWPARAAPQRGRLRRRPDRAADQGAARRGRDPRGHPGPAAWTTWASGP